MLSNKKRNWLGLLSIVVLCFFVTVGLASAQITGETRAKFEDYRTDTTVKVRPNGTTPGISPGEHGDMLSNGWASDLLWVAGNSQAWAHLSFWNDSNQIISPLVKVEGTDRDALYGFPCRVEQAGEAIWGFADVEEDVCDTVIANDAISAGEVVLLKADIQKLSNGSPSTDQLEITPLERPTIIRVYNISENLAVEILAGSAQIAPAISSLRDLSAGSRYIQSPEGGRVESFDLSEAWDSPSMESYLEETNWSSDVSSLLEALQSVAPTSSQPIPEEAQQILDVHNQLRAEVGVPSLSWSTDLATLAQDWADTISRENGLRHRPRNERNGAGENIAAGSNVGLMLGLWTDEKRDYDPNTGTCRPGTECKHYTQMVWRDTTEVGCGVASHGTYGRVLVCNYRPAGNFIGRPAY